MRQVDIVREPSTDEGTFGEMFEGMEHICFTMERPWLDNKDNVSCVPVGSYVANKVDTPIHGVVFELQNVPSRSAILIHVGNIMTDSEGCILVGAQKVDKIKNGMPGVSSSRNMFDIFMTRFQSEDSILVNISQKEEV